MPPAIVSRKFTVPALPRPHVPRERLVACLAEGLHPSRRLTVVQAAPGAGKTALLAEYATVQARTVPVAWFGLTPAEQDPIVFFEHLAACVESVVEGGAKQAAGIARTLGRGGLPQAMGVLCDDLARAQAGPFILILDGVEYLPGDPESQEAAEALAAFFPEDAQLVLSGRLLPGIKLAQFRLGNRLVQVGDRELRLSAGDIESFRAAFGLGQDDRRDALLERTRGWVAGVVYALAAEPSDPERPMERPDLLYEYLAEEVYARIPAEVRSQLLICSFLDEINPRSCRVLLDAEADSFLEALGAIPFAQREADGYVLHPIFGEFLRRHARVDLAPGDRAAIFRRLADRQATSPQEAVHWLIQGALWEEAERKLREAAPVLVRDGRIGTLRSMVQAFPGGMTQASPWLQYYLGEIERLSGNLARALEILEQAQKLATSSSPAGQDGASFGSPSGSTAGSPSGSEPDGEIGACLGRIWSSLAATHGARGDAQRQHEFACRALDALPADARDAVASCHNVLGMFHIYRHEPAEAETALREALIRYQEIEDALGEGRVLHNLGLAFATAGDFNRAISFYRESIRRLEHSGQLPLPLTFNNLALCLHYQGRQAEAWSSVETGMAVAERLGALRDRVFLLQTLGRLHLHQGETARARESFESALAEATSSGNRLSQINAHLGLAEWHLRTGDPGEAAQAVDRALGAAGRALSDPAMLEAQLILAEADLQGGRLEPARKRLGLAKESLAATPHPFSALHVARLEHEVCVRLGDTTEAGSLAEQIAELCDKHGLPLPVLSAAASTPLGTIAVPTLDLRTLGGFVLAIDGAPVAPKAWRSANCKLALAYLLMNSAGATREALQELLYPDEDPTPSALHVVINRLRHTLEPDAPKGSPSRFVLFQEGRYLLNRGLHVRFDVSELRQAISLARRPGLAPAERRVLLDAAIAHYRGPFLEEFPDVEWCRIEREGARRLAHEAFEERFALAASADDWQGIEALADAWIGLDPGAQVAFRAKVVALAMQERAADALRLGQVAEAAIRRASGSDCEQETREVLDLIRSDKMTVRAAREALPSRW